MQIHPHITEELGLKLHFMALAEGLNRNTFVVRELERIAEHAPTDYKDFTSAVEYIRNLKEAREASQEEAVALKNASEEV